MVCSVLLLSLWLAPLATGGIPPGDPVPPDPAPRWFKGNLHTHSLWSDGNDFPEMIAEWYRAHGYDFLALSDHNILSQGMRWMKVADIERRGGRDALAKYRARFGDHWVETRGGEPGPDGAVAPLEVRLKPLNEFRALVEERGRFLLIQAQEVTDALGRIPIHINAANLRDLITPQGTGGDPDADVADVMRRNLRAIEEQARRTGQPILAHLNHPNYVWAVTAEEIAEVVEERFFEVFNGHTGTNNAGDAQHASTEVIWDVANTIRLARLNAAPLYGLATDDSHSYHGEGDSDVSVPGRGWIMVRARHLTPESLIRSIEAGDFYASTGVALRDVRFDATTRTLTIDIEPMIDPATGASVAFTTRFIGTRRVFDDSSIEIRDAAGNELRTTRRYSADVGAVLAIAEGLNPSYSLKGDELYVRAVVTASIAPARPTKDSPLMKAWTQPVGWVVGSVQPE